MTQSINKTNPDKWLGKPYHSLNAFFREKFGEKVYRISIDAGFTCPNRDGTKGTGGCIYCNEEGSRSGYVIPGTSITIQLKNGMEIINKRYRASKYLVYFQPYTNTYAPVNVLESIYREALKFDDVVGMSIGTRPDCIDEEKLSLLESIAENKLVIIEFGVQSLKNETLNFINRGHSAEETINAIIQTKKRKKILVLAHVIFGLPGESSGDMINTIQKLIKLGIDAFKFHHLYVERRTMLERLYLENKFRPLELSEYLDILLKIIPILPENIVIHRLFGQCQRDNLISPLWTLDKSKNIAALENLMTEKGLFQGKFL